MTSFTDTGVTNGTAYFYNVEAIDSSGTSPQSSEATATLSAGFIGSVSTDAARYAPGSTAAIYVNLTNTTEASASGDVGINLTQLGSLQTMLPAQTFSLANGGTDTLTFTWVAPTTDFQGYSVQTNVAVRYYYGGGTIGCVFWASPDTNNGRMTSLSLGIPAL
jgi:hypothetical protein